MRSKPWFKLWVCTLLSACGDDAVTPEVSDGAVGKDTGTVEPEDAAASDAGSEDAADPASDAALSSGTTQDRCLKPGCVPSRLPGQPALTFLEDMGDGWKRLMEADWQLAAGAEGYRCMRLTVPEDVYVIAFSPQSPGGTHHATFGISSAPTGPDEVVACDVTATGTRRLQGSGAGSKPSELPDGVAMRLRKGEQILMNLHLFNLSDAAITGRSGMWIKTATADEVKIEAEAVLAGPLALSIPSGRSIQRGSCTMRADATIYGVSPHMHQLGVHLKATAQGAGGETMIYDGAYDFSHQLFHDIPDVQLKKGDVVRVECTYQNDTTRTVSWGDSSLDEMCFVGLGLYPAIGYGGSPCFQ
ncbi:MAG TPA: hypothetical protein VFZ61_03435 [Polyangiales bacterium]